MTGLIYRINRCAMYATMNSLKEDVKVTLETTYDKTRKSESNDGLHYVPFNN